MNGAARVRRLTPQGLAAPGEGGAPVRERLMSMLFMAGIAHAIVILGLSFSSGDRPSAVPGMEVLLVSDELPETQRNDHAVYLAQRTQLGAGNTRTLATGSPEAQRASAAQTDSGDAAQAEAASATAGEERMLTTGAPAPVIRWLGQVGEDATAAAAARRADAGVAVRLGRGDAQELVLRGDPKTGRWISPDTRASRLAPYLDAWRRKVERVGTLNFPAAARRADLSGSPVIEVALGSDGRLIEATIRRGSGHPEIDQAALLILRLASPFEPFPRELAINYDALRFAYQWDFFGGQLGTGTVTTSANGSGSP